MAWTPTHRHYKGGLYRLVGIGKHSETEEDLAIYESQDERLWARPLAMWNENVEVGGQVVPRFTPLTPSPSCAGRFKS